MSHDKSVRVGDSSVMPSGYGTTSNGHVVVVKVSMLGRFGSGLEGWFGSQFREVIWRELLIALFPC